MNFKNFGHDKSWPLTRISHRMYVAMPGELSPWRVVPGWSLESSTFDFMHNLYLGSGRDLLASTFKVLIQRGVYSHLPFLEMDSILAFLQEEMIRDCSMLGFLGVICFCQSGPPKLKITPKIIYAQCCHPLRKLRLRLYLPKKPALTETCLGDGDYAELSTKYKACHVKIMIYWAAKKTQEAADANQHEAWIKYLVSLVLWVHIPDDS